MSRAPNLLPRLRRVLLALAAMLLSILVPAQAAEDNFLEPENAYRFSARALDDRSVEVRFDITPGYYMYREQLKFAAEPATLGPAEVPPGKVKFDETFQRTSRPIAASWRSACRSSRRPGRSGSTWCHRAAPTPGCVIRR